jgi:hypothetical protein
MEQSRSWEINSRLTSQEVVHRHENSLQVAKRNEWILCPTISYINPIKVLKAMN